MQSSPLTDRFLAAIVRASADAIYSHALDGSITSWNAAAERLFGYHADEIVGTSVTRLAAPGAPDDTAELVARLARGEHVERYETVRYTRDARPIRIALSLSPIRDDADALQAGAGAMTGVAAVAREMGVLLRYEDVIAAAEQRFRGIVEAAPNALVIVDESGRIEYANARFAELFGYEDDEVAGADIREILPGRSADRTSILLGPTDQPALEVDRADAVGRRRDGSEVPIELGINTFRAQGRQMVAASIIDLSARRAVENEVIEIARQQAVIADLSRAALQVPSVQELLDEASEVVARVLDADLSEVLEYSEDAGNLRLRAGHGWRHGRVGEVTFDADPSTFAGAAFHGNDSVMVRRAAEQDASGDDRRPEPGDGDSPVVFDPILLEHGLAVGVRLWIPGGSGRFGVLGVHRRAERPFERRELNFLRSVVNILGTAIDHRRAVEELRATTETLNALVTALPIAVTVLDLDGTVRLWNPAAEQLFGLTASEVIDQRDLPVPAADRDARDALLARIAAGATVSGVEGRRTRPDGSVVDVQVHGAPLRDDAGTMFGVVQLVVDVTATKRLEEELLQSQKMESIGRLAGGVAHDFNNLLTGIFGYTALLADELPPGEGGANELVRGIQDSAEKAAGLTAQLLAFSRRQVLQPRLIDPNTVVSGIEPLLRRIIGETITLVTLLRPGTGRIMADPTQLEQVIVNLVVNARDAMPAGGTVAIETGTASFDEAYSQEHFDVTPGDYVLLAVSDGGVGMDAETRLHLFEPFFTTKGPGKGTGLGLATTYGIVKQSGGHIWLYSEPGRGTTFKLYFPLASAAVGPGDGPPSPAPPRPAAGTGTILFVEDEEAVRSVVTTVLQRNGYRVLAAPDGAAAIEIAESSDEAIELLITDVVMPGIGGRALADRIREIRPEIRTLFISGYTEDAIMRQGVLDADVAFLPKPFSPETLARTVAEVLHVDRAPVGSRVGD